MSIGLKIGIGIAILLICCCCFVHRRVIKALLKQA